MTSLGPDESTKQQASGIAALGTTNNKLSGTPAKRMAMMRFSVTMIAAVVLAAVASPVLADDQRDGSAFYAKGEPAFGNSIETVRLDAKDLDTHHNRSAKEQAKSDLNQIIVHYNGAIRRDPKDDDAYFHRGLANFYAGALPQAVSDLSQASKLDPEYAYYALWIDIIDKRGNMASPLPQATAHITMAKWPAPVLRTFLRATTPSAALPP